MLNFVRVFIEVLVVLSFGFFFVFFYVRGGKKLFLLFEIWDVKVLCMEFRFGRKLEISFEKFI